ncbi:acyl-CoA dehydrogenase family protein [Actinosynnema pretiosum subsp. pretiosum]|uniref:Acyl-CoA dehydrogenase type 2 domain protein n=3 Tax=Actinosynnema TaxID=40566 RepID=C6WN20_ACTMD|nr:MULTISPECIES: acyl-CoA dehydrogenase family protein [Actinosynnema]ACU38533.1 acyl-CoA dehydrogenase type 2 domain protein [Actinosynnema mirum DSM 43827]ATE55862.1 acyl-CoA dehydrogenase [Actinosynnema pretiosum]AXX32129.1 acyl-CoA dehydrogenase type 2 domain protein [Actinosynnema pretiosum subsp. pretiosum]QUF03907.1 acyl-CoA dehydrogenase family protein [Actinosynnema pretiosum subsp. pretiosum]
MTTTDLAVDVSTVLGAVAEIAPALRANGPDAESERRVPEKSLSLLEQAGVFRLTTPRRFGGLELPLADQAKVFEAVAKADGATGWAAMILQASAWIHTTLSEQAQQEIFTKPDLKVSTGFTPTGTIVPAEGGWTVNGTWKWLSGVHAAEWVTLAAVHVTEDGGLPYVVVVPTSEVTINDDWDTSAAEGTGSASATVEDVFVPTHRSLFLPELLGAGAADRANSGATGSNYAFLPYIMVGAVAAYIGIAKGAYETFLDRLPGRGITYTPWTNQSESPLTHIQVATAKNRIAAAEALADRITAGLQAHADAGTYPSVEERAQSRGEVGMAIQLAKEAVVALHEASGASSISRDVPFQRFHRDMLGLSLHALFLFNTNMELHGRVLLGLSPDTPFL